MSSFLLFSVFVKIAGSVMVTKPRNTAAVAGTPMFLECRVTNNSHVREWWVKRFLNRQTVSDPSEVEPKASIFSKWGNTGVLTNQTNFPYFGAEVDSYGSGILYSNQSSLRDAGIYTCVAEVDLNDVYFSAEVTILHDIPRCEAGFKQGDVLAQDLRIWLRCSVTFRGTWVPEIQWKHHRLGGSLDSDEDIMLDGSVQSVIAGSNITSTLLVIITSAKNLSRYSGTVCFPPRNRTPLRAEVDANPPSFNYSWTSPMIQVIPLRAVNLSSATSTEESSTIMVNSYTFPVLVIGVASIIVVITVVVTATLCIRIKRKTPESRYERNSQKSKSTYSTLNAQMPKDFLPGDTDLMESGYDRVGEIYDVINDTDVPGNAYDKIDESCVDNPPVLFPSHPITEPPSPGYLQARPNFLMQSPYLPSNEVSDKDYTRISKTEDQTGDHKYMGVNSKELSSDKVSQTQPYLVLMPDESTQDNKTMGYATSIEFT